MPTARLTLSLALVVFLASAAIAQEEAAPAADPGAAAPAAGFAAPATDPDVKPEVLRIYLKPLEKEQLEAVAKNWKDLLRDNSEKIAALEAEKLGATGARPVEIATELRTLRSEQDGIVERFQLVLAALKAKGGDVAAMETYIGVVTGQELDIKDASALWSRVKDWVVAPSGGIKTGMNIVFFILTIIAFRILASILGGITRRAVSTMRRTSDLLRHFFVNTVRNITFLIGLVVALSMIGIDVGPFVAAIGAVGFIIGFALQGTLSNFAAGIMILLYRPYDVGQVVSVAGVTGKVSAMSLVSTTLLTPDNQTVTVPNGSIWGGIITNITGNPTRRVDLVFGIGYDDDIGKAMKILEDVVKSHELVLADPAPVIQLDQLADSSVNFVVRPWAKTADYWTVKWDLTRAVKERFDAEGISIPFPQRDVHLHTVAAAPSNGSGDGDDILGLTRQGV